MMLSSSIVIVLLLQLFLSLFSSISTEPIELAEIRIPEHTSIGHHLITLHSFPIQQRYSYRFVSNNHREIQQYFTLNSSTGQLTIAADIDREKICSHRHLKCKFLLKIFELFNETLYHIPIVIDDINDHRPIFPYKSSNIQLHLSENSPPIQSKLFLQQAHDLDQLDQDQQLKYDLKPLTNPFPFRLETNTDGSNRLALVLLETLDRERIESYQCTLQVTDTADHHEQLHITILIDDVNDQSPIFDREKYTVELSENTPINTTILRVHATDADSGANGEIRYDFSDASKQFSNTFLIDHRTGHLRLRSSLDYEQRTSYVFYIQAKDLGQESRSSQTLVNISVIDENDCVPKIHFRFLPELNYNPTKNLIEISESQPMDKFFAQILVSDDDSGERGQVRLWFEIIDEQRDNERTFSLYPIDNSTYFFNRTKPFDFETQQWHRLIFYAQDFDRNKPLQSDRILTIHVLDENDNAPRFLHSFYHLSINENNQANLFLTQIEAIDPDSGENGRLTYEILTNETSFPFTVDSNTGMLYCSKSFDREERNQYQFEVIARDHGSPLSLASKIPIRIDINDMNDNKPEFEQKSFEFTLEENRPSLQMLGIVRARDKDVSSKLFYSIEHSFKHSLFPFRINQEGQIFSRYSIDREMENLYQFNVTVSDNTFQTIVPVTIRIIDQNDCQPEWKKPSENDTVLILNKDLMKIGSTVVKLEAIDRDDPTYGNGLISYTLEQIDPSDDPFLIVSNNGELILNSSANIGRYRVVVRAKDQGQSYQYSNLIQFYLLIGDNTTNGSLFYDFNLKKSDHFFQLNSLTTTKRVLLLSTFFISIAIILAFIICMILVLLCRYRREKYLYYIKCKAAEAVGGNHSPDPTMIIVENRLTNFNEHHSSSNSSKLSLEELHQKRLIEHSSSSPLYPGANIFSHHSSSNPTSTTNIIKGNQTTSDYYSNSSKHEEDADEWNEEQQQQQQQQKTVIDHQNEWSIEKILYPDWLYKNSPDKKKNSNSSQLMDFTGYPSFRETPTSLTLHSQSKRSMSSSLTSTIQASPKQVRFGGPTQENIDEQTKSQTHLTTSLKHLRTGTILTRLQTDAHDTFI